MTTAMQNMPSPALMQWQPDEYAAFGQKTQINTHNFHQLPLFSRSALIDLLHAYPRRYLQVFTMGHDPTDASEWRCVDIADGTSGEAIWRAVEVGRFWLNIMAIEEYSAEFAELIDGIYAHLDTHCPHLRGPEADYSTLLISSPGAQVYYHMDKHPNMLWHIHGNKRIWVYPALDTRFMPQHLIEDIYAGARDEEAPYQREFDAHAINHLLQPGEVASWPHNGPHRIENLDMNVSLATSYYTPLTQRRIDIQMANRTLLRPLGIKHRSMAETGALPALKRYGFKALRFGYKKVMRTNTLLNTDISTRYITNLQIDPDAPNGMRELDRAIPASFSSLRYAD